MSQHPTTSRFADIILDSIADGVFTVDEDWRITSFNQAAERITGISREDAIGSLCCEIFRANICENGCAIKQALDTTQPVVNKTVYIVRPDGKSSPISVSATALLDENGAVIGGAETFRDLTVVEHLRKELLKEYSFADIIGRSGEMRKIFQILPTIAASLATVLIEGPSGSGKELIARALHRLSPREDGPFVAVNCSAIPDTLLESELFGYKAGAFTDAREDRIGRFGVAEGGTLFLDEIGDITTAMQVRLLRVLQEKSYEPLGSNLTVTADVRILAATNKSLTELVRTDRFREDLYYRLNVISITLPPLSSRTEDIPLLVDHFLEKFNALKNKEISSVSSQAMALLLHYDYPGNVRELENFIEHAFVLCPGQTIEPEHLPDHLLHDSPTESTPAGRGSFAEVEALFIREALASNGFNRSATARELGIHKTTLWRKMKKLNIDTSGFE